MSLDSQLSIRSHKRIIQNKRILNQVYRSFYLQLKEHLPKKGRIIEIGSGGGFLKEIIPGVITTDLVKGPEIDRVFSAEKIPFRSATVGAYVMLNVFHHFKDPVRALSEMERTLMKGGKIIMIEPWNSLWSRFIFKNFHHEDFDEKGGWKIVKKGRMTGANGALPWIMFQRDQRLFKKRFPHLKISRMNPHSPLKYLVTGGLSGPQIIPDFLYPGVLFIERVSSPIHKHFALFCTIELTKV